MIVRFHKIVKAAKTLILSLAGFDYIRHHIVRPSRKVEGDLRLTASKELRPSS